MKTCPKFSILLTALLFIHGLDFGDPVAGVCRSLSGCPCGNGALGVRTCGLGERCDTGGIKNSCEKAKFPYQFNCPSLLISCNVHVSKC